MSARCFTLHEIAVLEAWFVERGRLRDRMLLLLGVNVGYRITELLSVTVGQVLSPAGDVAHEVIVPRSRLKGGAGVRKRSVQGRRVVLNGPARAAIRDYLASLDHVPAHHEFLFRSREGGNRPLHRSQVHRILQDACLAAGVNATRVSTHSLRKTFVRAVYDASGKDIVLCQRTVGHQSVTTTARYLDSTQSELDDLVLSIGSQPPASASASAVMTARAA